MEGLHYKFNFFVILVKALIYDIYSSEAYYLEGSFIVNCIPSSQLEKAVNRACSSRSRGEEEKGKIL